MPFNGSLYISTSNINLISTEPKASDFTRWLFAYQKSQRKEQETMITRSKANAILADMFGDTIYIGLSTTTPDETGGNFTEPTAGDTTGYKRAKVEVMSKYAGIEGQMQNSDIIFFPECLEAWGTITHFGVFSAQVGGVPYFWGQLTPNAVQVAAEYIPIFRKYALMIGLDKDSLEVPPT